MYKFLIEFIFKVFGLLSEYTPCFTYRIEGVDDNHFVVYFEVDDDAQVF